MLRRQALVVAASIGLLAGCATQPLPPPDQQGGMARAVGQPFRDLSVIREAAPDVLRRAALSPYDPTGLADCNGVADELARLDAALGPDLAPGGAATGGVSAQGLASDLIGGAIGLPYRGILRRVTGAEARDRALHAAVLAGMVRRGFVKGRLALMACGPASVALAQPAVIPPSTK